MLGIHGLLASNSTLITIFIVVEFFQISPRPEISATFGQSWPEFVCFISQVSHIVTRPIIHNLSDDSSQIYLGRSDSRK